jgi:putative transposase
MEKRHITLEQSDRTYLEALISKGSMKVRKQKRIQALLYLDDGKSFQTVSGLLKVTYQTVSKWAEKYKESKLSFLEEQPRSGRPVKFDGSDRSKVTALACSEAPQGHSQWSLRLLADRLVELEMIEDISYSTVGLILKKTLYNPIGGGSGA